MRPDTIIRKRLSGLSEVNEFAQTIVDVGFELMGNGTLDSDELVWQLARELWKDKGESFERLVSDEYHKILEAT